MFRRTTLAILLVFAVSIPAGADTWDFDKAHSSIGFSVSHLVISKTKGFFRDYSGHVEFDGKNPDKGSVEITIQVASIDTDDEKRDDHLRSADFFDVEKYPSMKFKSKKIIKGFEDKFTIIGDLTIKDVTREVNLKSEFRGVLDDPWGNTKAGFYATTKINRQDFNVAWSNKLKDGSLIVGDEVTITIEMELLKMKPLEMERAK